MTHLLSQLLLAPLCCLGLCALLCGLGFLGGLLCAIHWRLGWLCWCWLWFVIGISESGIKEVIVILQRGVDEAAGEDLVLVQALVQAAGSMTLSRGQSVGYSTGMRLGEHQEEVCAPILQPEM